jgi:hypothetical protein
MRTDDLTEYEQMCTHSASERGKRTLPGLDHSDELAR